MKTKTEWKVGLFLAISLVVTAALVITGVVLDLYALRWCMPVLLAAYAEDLPLFTRLSGLDTSGWTTSRLLAGELSAEEGAEKLGRKAGLVS